MKNLTLNAYQAETSVTAIYKQPVIYTALGLVSEAGEIAGKLKKIMRDYNISADDLCHFLKDHQRAELAAEIGDVLWYCSQLSRDLNISLNEVATMNLEKLSSRKIRGTLGGSGDNR